MSSENDAMPRTSLIRENSWSMIASNAASATPSLTRSQSSSSSSSQPPTPFMHLSRDNSVSSASDLSIIPSPPSRETSFEIVPNPSTPTLNSSSSSSASQGPRVTSWAAAVKRTLPARPPPSEKSSSNFRVIEDHYSASSSSPLPINADDPTALLPCGCTRAIAGGEQLRGLQLRHTCQLDDPTNQQAAHAGLYKYHPSHVVPDFARTPSTDNLYSSDYDEDDDTDGTQHALDLLEGSTRERVSLAHKSSSSASASGQKSRKQLRMESVEWLKSLRDSVSNRRKHFETILEEHRKTLQVQGEWIHTTSSQKRNNRFSTASSKREENGSQPASSSTPSSSSASSSNSTSEQARNDSGDAMIMPYPSPCRWSDFQSAFLQHFLPLVLCQFDNVMLGTEIVSISRIEPEKPKGQPYYGMFNMAHFNHAHGFVDQQRKAPQITLQVKPTVYLELGCAQTLRGAVLRNRYGDGSQLTDPKAKAGHTPAVCAEVCQGAYNAVLGAGYRHEGTELSEVYKLLSKLPAHSSEIHTAYLCAQVVDQEQIRMQNRNWQWIHSERTPFSRFSKPRAQPSYKWSGEYSCGTSTGVTTMLEVKFKLQDPKKHKPSSQ